MTETNQYQGTLKIVIPNKYVACKPYIAVESKGGVFKDWQIKNPLVELQVVFSDKEHEYVPGSNIYIRPFTDQPSWLRDVFTLCGQEVILVPKEAVVGYKFVEEVKIVAVPGLNPYPWHQQIYRDQFIGSPDSAGAGSGTTITLPNPNNVGYTVTLIPYGQNGTWCSGSVNVASTITTITLGNSAHTGMLGIR